MGGGGGGDPPRIDATELLQTDAAAAVNARSPLVASRVCGTTSSDVGLLAYRRALKSLTCIEVRDAL